LQRANKWWLGIYQFQMIGGTLFIGYGFPTTLTTFLTFFGFFNFIFPTTWIFDERVPANSTYYNTIDYPAAIFLGYAGIEFENLALSVIILWAIAAVGLTIIFTIAIIIGAAVRGGNIGEAVTTRPIYVFLRMLDMGVFPFALFGGLSLVFWEQAGVSGIIGIIFIVVSVLYMLVVAIFFILVQVQEKFKGLFQPGTKGRCLFIYGHLKKETFAYAFVGILRRWLLGLLIGVFYGAPVGQLVSIIVVSAVFIPIYWVTDYFADLYQKAAETGVCVCNIIAFAILFGLSGTSTGILGSGAGSTVVAVLYIVVMAVSIGVVSVFFFFNWFQKEEQFSFNQIVNLILCKDSE